MKKIDFIGQLHLQVPFIFDQDGEKMIAEVTISAGKVGEIPNLEAIKEITESAMKKADGRQMTMAEYCKYLAHGVDVAPFLELK
jgi:rRNA maturation endonuclease Nob1